MYGLWQKKLDLTPELNHFICCPKCYFMYDIETAPHHCQYKSFPTSPPCGTSLFHTLCFIRPLPHINRISMHYSRTSHMQKNRKPFSVFVTQDFSNWLKWFIPQIQNLIEYWKLSITTTRKAIYNYQQSPAWNALYPKHEKAKNSTTLQLAFSLFVDQFNPLSNKTAGKKVFLSFLALNCLNLPPTS
ncbi:hypothetical protein O181_113659 [Austropuccinia psidii MF-1]|uniref:Uncharacterized protein n=1 Tax=Austropuccinia psidii MF-1 TaxID=1389203 RepID=A0A9Q3K3Y5_9BASI|nr:hypothetical protein [Austropuccinia psidii MF-1]